MNRHCVRCKTERRLEWTDPQVRKYAWVYFALGLPFVPFLPIIGAEGFVMIPSFALYMLGIVHVMAVLREPPTCSECGCEIAQPPMSLRKRLQTARRVV